MFFRSIHYLRGFAALAVATFHAFIDEAPLALTGGVDVFFVISGFVMVEATRNGFNRHYFLLARAARILPPYWIACALASVLVVSTPLRDWLLVPEATVMWGWPIPEPFLSPGWTLAYEALFYLLFAACLGRWWLTAFVLAALAGLGTVWQVVITNPIVLEFIFGMALANIPRHHLARWSGVLLVGALSCFLLAATLEHIPMVSRWLILGIPSAALVAGLVGIETRIPANRVLHFLGSASYSIYLVHMIPMAWTGRWTGLALGVAAGSLMYLTMERPLNHYHRQLLSGLKPACNSPRTRQSARGDDSPLRNL